MTLLLTVFAAVITTAIWYNRKNDDMRLGILCFMFWGASIMWLVDAIYEFVELQAEYFTPAPEDMLNDAFLGLSVIAFALAMVMCLAAFAGCGSKEVDLKKAMETLNTKYSLSLDSIASADDLNKYYQVKKDDVKQFAAEKNKDTNSPVEVILVEAKDKDAASNVEKALQKRLNSVTNIYTSYDKDNVAMVKACKVTNENNIVTLIIAKDAEKMLETFNESIK